MVLKYFSYSNTRYKDKDILTEICESINCTGCSLCVVECPVNCIVMQPHYLGHLHPVIDGSKCIDCLKCQKVCPALNRAEGKYPEYAYAAWAKDRREYSSSTSGGVASILSQYYINSGGVVYGCFFDENLILRHARVTNSKKLQPLKGSKYVQSSIEHVLPEIRKDVKNQLSVLFIGTPCQIAAVRNLFNNKDPDNLLLVDLICHGVPSNAFLIEYIEKHLKITGVRQVNFRISRAYCLQIFTDDGLMYESNLWKDRYKDLFYNMFIDGFSFRDSCYSCPYSAPNRISDITIGDFWGLGKSKPWLENNDDDGISVILPITNKGNQTTEKIREELNIFQRPVEEAINGNHNLKSPQKKGRRIKVFRALSRFLPVKVTYLLVIFDRILKYKILKSFPL